MYKKNGGKLSRVNFLLEYIEDTVASYPIESQKLSQSRSTTSNVSRLIEKHFPDYIPDSSTTKNPSRRCAVCYKKKLEKNRGIGVRHAKCHYALFLVFVNITRQQQFKFLTSINIRFFL